MQFHGLEAGESLKTGREGLNSNGGACNWRGGRPLYPRACTRDGAGTLGSVGRDRRLSNALVRHALAIWMGVVVELLPCETASACRLDNEGLLDRLKMSDATPLGRWSLGGYSSRTASGDADANLSIESSTC
jgi:hypothetical protein